MEQNEPLLDLKVDETAVTNLNEMSRWAKFLSLSVLIGTVLSFIFFFVLWDKIADKLISSDELQQAGGNNNLEGLNETIIKWSIVAGLLFVMAIVGVLLSFLIKAANRIRSGIKNNDQMQFNSGLASLKSYFSMYGVLSIIMLVLSLLALVQLNK